MDAGRGGKAHMCICAHLCALGLLGNLYVMCAFVRICAHLCAFVRRIFGHFSRRRQKLCRKWPKAAKWCATPVMKKNWNSQHVGIQNVQNIILVPFINALFTFETLAGVYSGSSTVGDFQKKIRA